MASVTKFTPSLEILINELKRFPGIGAKSAERIALHILTYSKDEIKRLCTSIEDVHLKTLFCSDCFSITEEETCPICKDPQRNSSTICVIESFKDVIIIEKTGEYKGLYHVLNGHIAPLSGIGPDDLTISQLLKRINYNENIKEIIMATNPNVEGDATALYISQQVKNIRDIKITRLARGIPVGGDLEFADPITLANSFFHREDL